MRLSREEKSQRAKQRIAERKAEADRLPGARLDSCGDTVGVIVELEPGDDLFLRVAKRGQWTSMRKYPQWEEWHIRLDDLKYLGRFISALTARYNVQVDRINATAVKAHMAELRAVASEKGGAR